MTTEKDAITNQREPEIGDPAGYDPTRFAFVAGAAGEPIAVRPDQFLAAAEPEVVREELARIQTVDGDVLVDDGDDVRYPWRRYRLNPQSGIDRASAVALLSDRGFGVQPNYIYFANTRFVNPNLINPNLINPNLINPNLINPNLINPNLINPNLINPNLINPNLINPNLINALVGGSGCCCPTSSAGTELDLEAVPPLLARPIPAKMAPGELETIEDLEIHIIDVVGLTAESGFTGEFPGTTDPVVVKRVDENGDFWVDPGTAHGDFVRSVLQNAEGIRANLWSAIGPLGDIDDAALIKALQEVDAACSTSKKVLNLSLGGYNEGDRPSSALAGQIKAMVDGGWLIVASAGNLASCRPVWPAALPGVVAVGAIDKCDRPASFTNFGGWVDACALGVDVEAEFPRELQDMYSPGGRPYRVNDDPEITTNDFDTGWATWSGTSFAAPLVTARLARRLSRQPDAELTAEEQARLSDAEQVKLRRKRRARNAVNYLLEDPARGAIPGLGTIVR